MTGLRRVVAFLCVFISTAAVAGGPLLVGSIGVPQTWANGQVTYYTDQGDLSPLLPNAQANQFVADAWSRWTSVPLAALTVIRSGSLDEDVTGANFAAAGDLKITSAKPLVIIYDIDGKVVDGLLGTGAGAPEMCSTNSVIGQVDRISADGHIAHALVVINGNCARKAADLPILRYRLVRALGRILGLDYSQLNENVVTGLQAPSGDDYAGYPLMHPLGVLCSEVSDCLANADVPRMDDRAALARLYPSSAFATTTARVHGTVRFPDWKGRRGQGMQGVNVVARLVDPSSGRVSRQFAASCVSGFLFRGNAGNPITGYVNTLGERWDEHGSSDPALEGYYDLDGLELPDGYNAATFELSVEAINAVYNGSTAVGPYVVGQIAMPGSANAVRVTIARGAEVAQDFIMRGAASEQQDRWEISSFAQPRSLPLAGSWTASLSGYGDRDYYNLRAESNRTFTFDVTAIDANGAATVNKALPVLGVWSEFSIEDQPGVTETYFNTAATATTRLQAVVSSAGIYKLGVADYRGDGRPDLRYYARLFYGHKLTPARVGVQGGSVVTIEGFGFTAHTQVSVNGGAVSATLTAANQIVFRAPALADGTYAIALADSATGASSEMTDALIVGSSGAKLVLLNGANPQVPVGTVAPNPIKVQVVEIGTGVPVAGATVVFAAPSGVEMVGCSQSPCKVITDQNGIAAVQLLVKEAGASVVTATLPTGGSVSGTVNGVNASIEITLANPNVTVVAGATLTLPVTATVVTDGVPAAGKTVDFLKNYGAATIAPSSAVTKSDGTASSEVSVAGIVADVNISACVAPEDAPCRTLLIHPVAVSDLRLQKVSGEGQVINVGQSFAPMMLRVTDKLGDPVAGVSLTFDVHIYRASGGGNTLTGEVSTTHTDDTVVLSSFLVKATTDANGLAKLSGIALPAQAVTVKIRALAGSAKVDLELKSIWPNANSHQNAQMGSSAKRRLGSSLERLKKSFPRQY